MFGSKIIKVVLFVLIRWLQNLRYHYQDYVNTHITFTPRKTHMCVCISIYLSICIYMQILRYMDIEIHKQVLRRHL